MPHTKAALPAKLLAQIEQRSLSVCQKTPHLCEEDEIKSFLSAHLHLPQKCAGSILVRVRVGCFTFLENRAAPSDLPRDPA